MREHKDFEHGEVIDLISDSDDAEFMSIEDSSASDGPALPNPGDPSEIPHNEDLGVSQYSVSGTLRAPNQNINAGPIRLPDPQQQGLEHFYDPFDQYMGDPGNAQGDSLTRTRVAEIFDLPQEHHHFVQDEDDDFLAGLAFSNSPQQSAGCSETRTQCTDGVLAVFPDICPEYVSKLYDGGVNQVANKLITQILDNMESGTQYPQAKDTLKSLKRKREMDGDEEAANKYGDINRGPLGILYRHSTRTVLSGEFAHIPMAFIDIALRQSKYHLFPAYRVLEEAERTWDAERPPYNKIKYARKVEPKYTEDRVRDLLESGSTSPDTMLALRELQAARRTRKKADDRRQTEQQTIADEEENTRRAERDGTMAECGCCFEDHPLNRMVHCNNVDVLHWFCTNCARQTAETTIGQSKYELKCMSMDGCESGFSHEQKKQFLDEKNMIALDRNEQEAVLRMAGIENLASCPFCPFAAEYPPIEEERLFRCQAPDCEKVSCRLCKLESHIPKTCEEFAKENGLSIRRQIEEAMSAALIRKCNKCGTPFVKEEGCNKMTCTRNGCYNVQCYVCSKSCTYDHFNDRSRGGKEGNCPLFESVHERHEQEVKKAEKEALAKVLEEHPEYTDEDLRVNVSDQVKQDDAKRRSGDPKPRFPYRFNQLEPPYDHGPLMAGPGYIPPAQRIVNPVAAAIAQRAMLTRHIMNKYNGGALRGQNGLEDMFFQPLPPMVPHEHPRRNLQPQAVEPPQPLRPRQENKLPLIENHLDPLGHQIPRAEDDLPELIRNLEHRSGLHQLRLRDLHLEAKEQRRRISNGEQQGQQPQSREDGQKVEQGRQSAANVDQAQMLRDQAAHPPVDLQPGRRRRHSRMA
ncbi:MAG: hypothetical protein M1818_004266 [Claussenomyces sp. TS43310]|nr:MAG: hypothetical protein M1818_004266 [Claussenomyces sp. TS43310]